MDGLKNCKKSYKQLNKTFTGGFGGKGEAKGYSIQGAYLLSPP